MIQITNVNRRRFLELSAGMGLGTLMAACAPAAAPPPPATPAPAGITPAAKAPAATAPATKAPAGTTPAAKAPAAATPATKAPATKGGPLPKLIAVSTPGILDNVHWMVGKQKGFFAEFGVDFEFVGVQSGVGQLDALLTKSANLVDSSAGPVLAAIEKGAPCKILAGSRPLLNYAFFSQKSIQSLKDLEGNTVGVGAPANFAHNVATALLKKAGVDTAKVQFANLGTSADIYRALVVGKAAAGVSGVTYVPSADRDGLKVLAEFWKELPDYLTWSFYTSDDFLKEKSDALARALAGYARTYRYVRTPESKDLFMKIGVNDLQGKPEEVEFYWNFIKTEGALAVDLQVTPKQIEFMQQLNVAAGGTQDRILPFEQVTDLSIQKKALELLKG